MQRGGELGRTESDGWKVSERRGELSIGYSRARAWGVGAKVREHGAPLDAILRSRQHPVKQFVVECVPCTAPQPGTLSSLLDCAPCGIRPGGSDSAWRAGRSGADRGGEQGEWLARFATHKRHVIPQSLLQTLTQAYLRYSFAYPFRLSHSPKCPPCGFPYLRRRSRSPRRAPQPGDLLPLPSCQPYR